MTLVVDATVVVAALVDDGAEGRWATDLMRQQPLASPHLVMVESTQILRKASLSGDLDDGIASLALRDLLQMRIDLFPFEPLADRIWELRFNLTSYDAWYVALAEALDAPLATLDQKLAAAPGLRCQTLTP